MNFQEIIKKYEEISFYKKDNNEDDKNSCCNLLKEKYESEYYQNEDFPFYRYFYYTDYLNEEYIKEKLKHIDESRYPVLVKYLDYNNRKNEKDDYILNNINIFNNTLNLLNQKYFNNITREYASKIRLKDIEIYLDNKKLFDDFIEFYNNIKIEEIKNREKLSTNNILCDFFIDNENKFGKNYKIIYKYIIEQQNKSLENLIDIKINKGIFDINYKNKVNVQQINESEIFNLKFPKNISFIDLLFNCSYRKILDSNPLNYKAYKEYVIDFYLIEENMTDILLKNKKLLNDNVFEFVYNNELFNYQVSNIITLFKTRYIYKDINIDDKVTIYKFYEDNKGNIELHKKMINDFILLINEETKIYEILDEIKDVISNYFINLFEHNNSLIICKSSGIFDYYMKAILEDVNSYIEEYQEDLDKEKMKILCYYFEENNLISNKDFAYAIRLFIILVLFREEDKEKKIKRNRNNVINYLKSQDLWKIELYNSEKFNENLKELKLMNIQINQVIPLYKILGGDIYDNFFDDVIRRIKVEENEKDESDNPELEEDDDNNYADDDEDDRKD